MGNLINGELRKWGACTVENKNGILMNSHGFYEASLRTGIQKF